MNSIYNDSLIVELRELTTRENACANKLLSVCDKVKNKVFDMVSLNDDLSGSLRYVMHLRSELAYKIGEKFKKK